MKGPVSWFADNHVAANLLMLFLLLTGLITAFSAKIEVFPETSLDAITITTVYPGASPAEVEEAVVRHIEEKVAGLAGVKRVDSIAREGVGVVTLEVMKGWSIRKLLDEVKAEVDGLTTLPDEAEKPRVNEITHRSRVLHVAVFGDAPEAVIRRLARKVKDDITNLPGVTMAEIRGMRKAEVQIEISEEILRRHGLTLGRVADAVSKGSLDLPAGSIKTDAGEILIRARGRRRYAKDFRDMAVITRADGARVTLGQIAEIRDGFEERDVSGRFQGKPCTMITVYRVADQNALSVAAAVKGYVAEARLGFPEGVDLAWYRDHSRILKSRMALLARNLGMGLILVVVMLWLFMNTRMAFWVTLGIPISFAAGLMLLPRFDVSINMISLFAFIMVLGIVVDDAIIIGENIYRKQETGLKSLDAAVTGAVEVGRPVIFSVLTTMVAFWPLLLAGGFMGKLVRNIPIVVNLVLLGSLVEALFILPAHLAGGARKKALDSPLTQKEKFTARWLKWVIRVPYAWLVNFCVRWRYAFAALSLAILLVSAGLWNAGLIKFTFFPKVEGDTIRCYITMPMGTPVERTEETAARLETAVREMLAELDRERPEVAPPLLKYSVALIGRHAGRGGVRGEGGHLAQMWIQLVENEKRDVSAAELTRMWRERISETPDVEHVSFRSEIHGAGNPVEVHLSLDDHEELLAAAEALKEELRGCSGVFDVKDSFLPGKEEMQLKLKRAARGLGLTLNDLARQVRSAFHGAEALRFQRDGDEVRVVIRYPQSERKSTRRLEEMQIQTPGGSRIPFSQAASVNTERGYTSIERAQRFQVVKVTADVDETAANANEVRKTLMADVLPRLKSRHPGLRCELEGEGREQRESWVDVKKGFYIALFCIYALLAIPFKSFFQPVVVMAAIPFGFVGAMLGHLIMGFNISVLSLFGMVGLTGVVVNDSLVLVYAANRIRARGVTPHAAVTRAGGLRFRAIVLTTLTTFAGLTPILLEKSVQAQFLIPMAVSLGFGVLFSTGVTLLLIPCGYMIFEDLKRVFRFILRALF
ncbi:MAG: efflux RND transporter permease subunit [Desulfobacterales bacterium]|nr:efflux RND transporter permease subunit [Desulfobacterales bacterium]